MQTGPPLRVRRRTFDQQIRKMIIVHQYREDELIDVGQEINADQNLGETILGSMNTEMREEDGSY